MKLNIFVASLKNIKFSHSSRGPENIENELRSFRFTKMERLQTRDKEISKLDIESVKIKIRTMTQEISKIKVEP